MSTPQNTPVPTVTEPPPPLPEPLAEPLRGWRRVKFIFKVVEIRLRFIAILLLTFLIVGYWDTIKNYWDKWTRPSASVEAAASDTEYYCPMHPKVIRAGRDPNGAVPKCPICGMPLSLRKKGEAGELPPGVTGRVQLSPDRMQMAGVQTAEVTYRPLAKEIRTVGAVEFDETKRSQIVSRVDGYVEVLYVDKTYVAVHKGDPLAEIYSPDLYSTAQELLGAVKRQSTDLVAGAKERLHLLGIGDEEIDEIVRSGKAPKTLTIRSPQTGHVIDKKIVAGSRVMAGATLFEIADLSAIWIEADVFEADASFIRAGQEIAATVESVPNRVFSGKVALVHPHVETTTRTNRVRFELDNPEHELRPGMYATITIKAPLTEIEPYKSQIAAAHQQPAATDDATLIAFQKNCPVTGKKLGSMGTPVKVTAGSASHPTFLCCKGCVAPFEKSPDSYLARLVPPEDAILAVPERAVIDTGTKKVVYIEREPGLFEGIEVELGPRIGEFYPVSKGLLVGDRVAAAGAFLIDAETRLNPAAASAYVGASGGPQKGGAGAATATPNTPTAAPTTDKLAPDKSASGSKKKPSADDLKELAKLSEADRKLATAQQVCPITGNPLGSMGPPYKLELKGKTFFLCCDGCLEEAKQDPDKTLKKVEELNPSSK